MLTNKEAIELAIKSLEYYIKAVPLYKEGSDALVALRNLLKEPDWKTAYLDCVDKHNETLDELSVAMRNIEND